MCTSVDSKPAGLTGNALKPLVHPAAFEVDRELPRSYRPLISYAICRLVVHHSCPAGCDHLRLAEPPYSELVGAALSRERRDFLGHYERLGRTRVQC